MAKPNSIKGDSVVVIGLGRFGSAVAQSLVRMGHDVMGIDAEEEDAASRKDASGWRLEPGLRATARGITARSTAPGEDEVIDGNAIAAVITPTLVLSCQPPPASRLVRWRR